MLKKQLITTKKLLSLDKPEVIYKESHSQSRNYWIEAQLQQPPAWDDEPSLPPDGPGIPPYPTLIP